MFKIFFMFSFLFGSLYALADQTPDALVSYDHVANIGQGNYIVYGPKVKGADDQFHAFSEVNSEVQRDTAPLKASVFNSETETICASFGFIRNYNAASDWAQIGSETFVEAPMSDQKTLQKHWWGTEHRYKLVVLYCANESELPRGGDVHIPVIGINPFPIDIPPGPHN